MTYTCPMHQEITEKKPGRCPKCGMKLVPKNQVTSIYMEQATDATQNSYRPLIIIISLIFLVTVVLTLRDLLTESFHLNQSMAYFMAGFFLVFSGFKLIDLKGFAEGYSTYDLLAKKVFAYGYIYPFLELLLGLLYAARFIPQVINLFTFILMTFSGIGVALKIVKHEKFQCACLGTFLKVPLTKVTLIEDFGMAIMALLML